MKENSPPVQQWLSIVRTLSVFQNIFQILLSDIRRNTVQIPLGFGNAVVLQTMLSMYIFFPILRGTLLMKDYVHLDSRTACPPAG